MKRLLVVVLALASASATPVPAEALSSFEFDGDAKGWSGNACASAVPGAEGLNVTLTCAGAALDSPVLSLDAAEHPLLTLTMSGSVRGPIHLTFTANGSTHTIGEAVYIRGDGETNRYTIPLRDHPAFMGTLQSLSIGLGPSAVGAVTLRSIQLGDRIWTGAWSFQEDGHGEGWTATETIGGLSVAGGRLSGHTTLVSATSPRLESPPGTRFDARSHRTLILKMSASAAGSAQSARVWWGTSAAPTLSVARSQTVGFTANGTEQEIRFDLYQHPKWTSEIARIWVEPFVGAEDAATFSIDSIGFGPRFAFEAPAERASWSSAAEGFRTGDGTLVGRVLGASNAAIELLAHTPVSPFPYVLIRAAIEDDGPCSASLEYRTGEGSWAVLPWAPVCDGTMQSSMIDASTVAGWAGELDGLRLTLPAGASAARSFEVDRIELLAPGPSLEVVEVRTPYPAFVGDVLQVSTTVENQGAETSAGGKVIVSGQFALLSALSPGAKQTNQFALSTASSCSDPSKQAVTVTAQLPGVSGLWNQAVSVPMTWLDSLAEAPPDVPPPGSAGSGLVMGDVAFIQNALVRIELHKNACLGGFGYMRMFRSSEGQWVSVGGRIGLGTLSVAAAAGTQTISLQSAVAGNVQSGTGELTLPLSQVWQDADGVSWTFEWELAVAADEPWVRMTMTGTPASPRNLRKLSGPAIEAGLQSASTAAGGLLGGVDLFGPDSQSGRQRYAGSDWARDTPDVRLVGVPVAATFVGNATVGLVWQPLTPFAGSVTQPSVRFQVPNLDDGRDTGLLELLAPNAPSFVVPGDNTATSDFIIEAGASVTLTGWLFAAEGAGHDTALRTAFQIIGTPPPSPWDSGIARARVRAALRDTGWQPGIGWKVETGAPAKPHPDILAVARRLADVDGDATLGSRADAAAVLAPAASWVGGTGEWHGMEAAWADGPTVAVLAAGWSALQQADAATDLLLLEPSPGVDQSNVGRARRAWRYIRFGRFTGVAAAMDAGLLLLDEALLADLPAGAAVQLGVPTAVPDVDSCVNLSMAALEAYLATDDSEYLDAALRWAWTAMAFVLPTDAPSQPAGYTKWGVLDGLGAARFEESLLGQLSARAGARVSLMAFALVPHNSSFGWDSVAEGAMSAVAARLNPDDDPNAGMVQAHWNLRDSEGTGALQLPHLLGRALLQAAGNGIRLNTSTVETPALETLVVTSQGSIGSAAFVQASFTVDIAVAPADAAAATVVTVGNLSAKPPTVSIGGIDIPEVASLSGAGLGWRYDADTNLLGVRRTGAGAFTISIQFPIPDADGDQFPANLDCNDDVAAINPDAPEVCNNIDDDCDSETDEPEDTGFVECGIGICAHSEPACVAGLETICDPLAGMADEVCDTLDNDCDGDTDEGVGTQVCGLGICEQTIDACAVCDPLLGAEPEVCDTVDNDCDGEIDETSGTIICGTGQCAHVISVCDLDICEALLGATEEVCDLIDNDCDGVTDEGLPTVPCGTGQCQHDIPACAPCEELLGATEEACDFVDNDCDGETDEGTVTAECGTGLCLQAIPECHVCQPLLGAQPEVCNGIDDDCNGEADDVTETKPCGTGQCYQEIPLCDQCSALAGSFDEVCDGLDNDCDGETDEVTDTAVCGLGACAHEVTGCETCDGLLGAVPETCNAVDDDCDGLTDEVDDLGTFECGTGECAQVLPNCTDGGQTVCDPVLGAADEVCDGWDNDCDGVTDDDIDIWQCGMGECEHPVVGCTLDGPGSCDPLLGAVEEVCDGWDNDCDGETDEDTGEVTCGVSLDCAVTLPDCIAGQPIECNPINGLAPELCNGVDDDCDGNTDEDQVSVVCGLGACLHSVPGCVDGVVGACDPLDGVKEETCNFQDDDCDGETDEDSEPVTCGLGICANTVSGCQGGQPIPCSPLDVAKPDVCNGEDDDCDGETDENQGEITCGEGACEKTIVLCLDGSLQECDPETGSAPEVCNGVDDDCDGDTDEELGTFVCGEGACQRPLASCTAGSETVCDPFDGLSPEVCDNIDNDCDGQIDDSIGILNCEIDGEIVGIEACQAGVAVTCENPGTTGPGTTSGDDGASTAGDGTDGVTTGTTSGAPPAGADSCSASPVSSGLPYAWVLLFLAGWFWLRQGIGRASQRRTKNT